MNEVLESRLMRPNHKFIYGDNTREEYFKWLANKYQFCSLDKQPVSVYLQDAGLKPTIGSGYDMTLVTSFNSRYFEMVMTYEIIKKFLQEASDEQIDNVASHVLPMFNYSLKEDSKFQTLEELREELLNTKNIYQEEYERYLLTKEKSDFVLKLRIFMVQIEFLLRRMKQALPNLDNIQLFINKQSEYSLIYTKVINFYIGARSNGCFNINVGCDNINSWLTSYDINGNIIQDTHDYDSIDLRKLERKR